MADGIVFRGAVDVSTSRPKGHPALTESSKFGAPAIGSRYNCGMPDQKSLDHLQELDGAVQRLLQHLNAAEQELQAADATISNYIAAHHQNEPTGHAIADSLKNISGLIQNYNDEHNKILGLIKAGQEEAQSRADDDNPY